MAGEQLNIEWVVRVINEAKAGIDSVIADYKKLGAAAAGAEKAGAPIGGAQQQQRMSGLHTRITQLTTGFRKLGVELETIDLYFISGFKVVGLFKLLEFAKQSIFSFENMRKGLLGVQLATEQAGFEMKDSLTSINTLLKMGRVGAEDLTEAMRNLLKKGFKPSEAQFLVESLIKSGTVFGTQANMPLAEAVKRATEGILLDLSRLVDATRLTKNLDQMWADYARTIGKTVDALDEHEKRQAVLQYFIKENIGLTEKYAQANVGLTKALGEFAVEWDKIKREVGQGLSIPITVIVTKTTQTMQALKQSLQALASDVSFGKMILNFPVDMLFAAYKGMTEDMMKDFPHKLKDAWSKTMLVKDLPIKEGLSATGTWTEPSMFTKAFESARTELKSYKLDFQNLIQETFGNESIITKILGFKKEIDSVFEDIDVRRIDKRDKNIIPTDVKYLDFDFPKEFSSTMADIDRFNKSFWTDNKLEEYMKRLVTLTDLAGKSALTTLSQEEKYVDNIKNMLTLVSEATDGIFKQMDDIAEQSKKWVDAPGNMIDLVNAEYEKISESMDKRVIGGKIFSEEDAEEARAWGTKIANAFSQPLERGISDVFFGIFTGEQGSIIDMAKNFGRSLGRAISDALAESIMTPVKSTFQDLFTTIGTSLFKSVVPTSVGAGTGLSEVRGFDFASAKSSGITINIGSGYTPNEIGSMVAKGVQESYSNNSVVRKVIKGQR